MKNTILKNAYVVESNRGKGTDNDPIRNVYDVYITKHDGSLEYIGNIDHFEAKDWKIVGKEENEIDKNDECCGYCITHKKDDGWGYAHSYTECRLDGDCDCHKEEEEPKGHMKDKLDKQLLELSYKHNNEITLAIDDIIQLIHDYSGYAIDQYIQGNLERRKDND